jgi:hypothetical protein
MPNTLLPITCDPMPLEGRPKSWRIAYNYLGSPALTIKHFKTKREAIKAARKAQALPALIHATGTEIPVAVHVGWNWHPFRKAS